jgi:hypothetical protein
MPTTAVSAATRADAPAASRSSRPTTGRRRAASRPSRPTTGRRRAASRPSRPTTGAGETSMTPGSASVVAELAHAVHQRGRLSRLRLPLRTRLPRSKGASSPLSPVFAQLSLSGPAHPSQAGRSRPHSIERLRSSGEPRRLAFRAACDTARAVAEGALRPAADGRNPRADRASSRGVPSRAAPERSLRS